MSALRIIGPCVYCPRALPMPTQRPQQHSDQTRKPVKSEQDSCSFDGNHGQSLALSGDPVDQTCGIQQRCCLIEQLLDVEGDFKALLMKARTGAGIGCAPYSRGLIKPVSRQFYFAVAAKPSVRTKVHDGCSLNALRRQRMARPRCLLAAELNLSWSLSVRPGPPFHHVYSIGLPKARAGTSH